MKILITGTGTLNLLKKSIEKQIDCQVFLDTYNSFQFTLLDKNSILYREQPDFVIVHFDEDANDVVFNKDKTLLPNTMFISNVPGFDYLIDFNKIIYDHGYTHCFNSKTWYQARIKWNDWVYDYIAKEYLLYIKPTNKKVLILDCDYTLWHGIASDNEARIAKHGVYSSFWDFQEKILSLKNDGFLLAICSKNDYSTIENTFNTIEMPLKLDDFVIVKANWENKAENIKSIAKELNLRTDSFVFLDDDAINIDWVKGMLPEVESYLLPENFTKYPQFLDSIYSLKRVYITEEDKNKTELYKQNFQREQEKEKFTSYNEFLNTLGVEYEIEKNTNHERIAQMTQKTNQFNLTGKVFTEQQLATKTTYTIKLKDKFGDYGIIGCAIVDNNMFENFIISCRAFNKKVEDELWKYVKNDFPAVELVFVDTGKNTVAREWYNEISKAI